MELAIEQALEETAPDLQGLEVEGVVEPAARRAPAQPVADVQCGWTLDGGAPRPGAAAPCGRPGAG